MKGLAGRNVGLGRCGGPAGQLSPLGSNYTYPKSVFKELVWFDPRGWSICPKFLSRMFRPMTRRISGRRRIPFCGVDQAAGWPSAGCRRRGAAARARGHEAMGVRQQDRALFADSPEIAGNLFAAAGRSRPPAKPFSRRSAPQCCGGRPCRATRHGPRFRDRTHVYRRRPRPADRAHLRRHHLRTGMNRAGPIHIHR